MSTFFPRFPSSTSTSGPGASASSSSSSGGDLGPLFRLLDDYNDFHQQHTGASARSIRAFQPRFDVRETRDAYELHGELPGIRQDDVQIEFVDMHTLVVKGRAEREYSEQSPQQGQGRITEADGAHSAAAAAAEKEGEGVKSGEHGNGYHKATVEDEEGKAGGSEVATTTKKGGESHHHEGKAEQQQPPRYRYWISERSVGEFHRSFSFPGKVDQDGVKASLKNGILTVLVPKSHGKETKRITIS